MGTAGKGTAAAAIVGRLCGAGARVGAHLSPHVYDLRERFLVDGRMASWDDVGGALSIMWPALHETTVAEGRPPSFFEVTTAISWLLGREAGVGYHVTEAGIGGELDATNAIGRTDKITVVMPIGFDHMDILGHDIRGIARTKAGVIAERSAVVMAPQPHAEAAQVVSEVAARRSATLHRVPMPTGRGVPWLLQADAVADAVVARLAAVDTTLDVGAPAAVVELPGRIEHLQVVGREVILDGAHNPLKLRALAGALDGFPNVVVAALSHEKALDQCASELAALGGAVITTDFVVAAGDRAVRRSWSAQQLADAIHAQRPAASVVAVPGIGDAAVEAIRSTRPGDRILVTGSFMMLDPARRALVDAASPRELAV